MMRVERNSAGDDELLDLAAPAWATARAHRIPLAPTPLGMVAEVSPYLSRVTGHGELRDLDVRSLHNGDSLSLHLTWADPTLDAEL